MTRNSVPKDITELLTANVAASGPFFPNEWGKKPNGDTSNKQTIIQDSPGGPSLTGDSYERPVFTMTMRGDLNEPVEPLWVRAVAVHDFLIQSPTVTINAVEYGHFEPMAPLQLMERDDQGRPMVFAKYFTYRNVR